jgi:NTP pyrophosphatase (non-canonical NTP hydrolase)
MKIKRKQIEQKYNNRAIEIIKAKLKNRLKQKGNGSFISRHEAFGVIAEEFDELLDELRSNNYSKFKKELIDIAVASIFTLACMEAETLE